MIGPAALLLTNDSLEAYAKKYGRFHARADLSPAGIFERVVVAYQAECGGRTQPGPGMTVYRIRARGVRRPCPIRAVVFLCSLVSFVAQAARIARRERVAVVRAYNPFVQGAVAVLAGRLAGRPSVVSVHTDPAEILARLDRPVARVFSLLERFTLARADRIWCTTRYLEEHALARGAPADRVRILPNRVDLAEFAHPDAGRVRALRERYAIPPHAPVVLSVARLDPEKDPLTILRAFSRLSHTGARLVLVGDGELRETVEREAARVGYSERVVIAGFRPREEISAFLHLADCFVLASEYEGFPFALAEALAAGVPVISSDLPHIGELLDGTGATRFRVGDPVALADRISEALADPARARAAAVAGRAKAAAFDRGLVDELEVALYGEVVAVDRSEVAVR